MSKKISVIIPIYNRAQYLPKCIDSILEQTYEQIEIVLVDDGSSDESPSICDKYALLHSNIRTIHKSNGGSSSARNAGLDNATGDYFSFIDSDDYLEKKSYEMLIQALDNTSCSIACMERIIRDSDYNITEYCGENTESLKIIKSSDYIRGICEKTMSDSVCDKLFKADMFRKHRFDETKTNEDFLLLSQLLLEGMDIVIVDYTGYNYYYHAGSISHSGFGKSIVDSVLNAIILGQESQEIDTQLSMYFVRLALFQIKILIILMPKEYTSDKEGQYKYIFTYLKKHIKFVYVVSLRAKDKVFLILYRLFPSLCKRIIDIIWSNLRPRFGGSDTANVRKNNTVKCGNMAE